MLLLSVISCKPPVEEVSFDVTSFQEQYTPASTITIKGTSLNTVVPLALLGEDTLRIVELANDFLKVEVPRSIKAGFYLLTIKGQGKTLLTKQLIVTKPTIEISGNNTLLKWERINNYILKGIVHIPRGYTLEIEEGTVIQGYYSTNATLIIDQGAKIIAKGTELSPIIFTSNRPKRERQQGDWGGLIVCGNAPPVSTSEQGLLSFGGTVANDNSGILQFVRIEFAGGPTLLPSNPSGALTLAGVGTGTVIENIQCSYSLGDSFRILGGTFNGKNLVSYASTDDDFDFENGYNGYIQYALALRHPQGIAAQPISCGLEVGDLDSQSSTFLTYPTISNFTYVGIEKRNVDNLDAINTTSHIGVSLLKNARLSLHNSLISGANLAGMSFDTGLPPSEIGTPSKGYFVGSSIFASIHPQALPKFGGEFIFSTRVLFSKLSDEVLGRLMSYNAIENVGNLGIDNLLNATLFTAPIVLPASSSLLLRNASFEYDTNLRNPFFEKVTFRGAFGSTDWTKKWTSFTPGTNLY